jgi:DNA-binding transcriptional LysR family regulator
MVCKYIPLFVKNSMPSHMDRFQEMQIFARIVERRSFTSAAGELHLPRATVTNAIKRLETRLGARLLERTTRVVAPTLDGQAYYERCVRLLADLGEMESVFARADPSGLLRVNLQPTLARRVVMPALPAFLARYPGIELQIGEGDRLVDLVREGIDCVLRVGNLQDSSLVAQQVARLEQVTVASPDYLARHGRPATLDELGRHLAVNYISSATLRAYPLEFLADGELRQVTLPGAVSVSGADMYIAGAIAGLGIVQVPRYRIENELRQDRLCVLLPDLTPPPLPAYVLYPQSRQLSPRVRVFVEWLKDIFTDFG